HSKHSTAEEFQIETNQLCDWISKKSKLIKAAPYIQKLSVSAKAKYPELEIELMKWFEELRSQQKTVSWYMIQAKARTLSATSRFKEKYGGIKNHKFSQKWVDGFMSKNNLVNRRRTTTAQHLPETYLKDQHEFLSL
ncbi:7820_t:CDS:1, partial [Gigaspora rosea]